MSNAFALRRKADFAKGRRGIVSPRRKVIETREEDSGGRRLESPL